MVIDLRNFYVPVYAIGIGDVYWNQLLEITGNKSRILYVESFDKLSTIVDVSRVTLHADKRTDRWMD